MLVQLVLGAAAVYMIYIGTVGKKPEVGLDKAASAGEEHIISESDRPDELGGAGADTGTKTATDEVQSHVTEPEKHAHLIKLAKTTKGAAPALTKEPEHHETFDTMTEDERDAVICADARAKGIKLPPWC